MLSKVKCFENTSFLSSVPFLVWTDENEDFWNRKKKSKEKHKWTGEIKAIVGEKILLRFVWDEDGYFKKRICVAGH